MPGAQYGLDKKCLKWKEGVMKLLRETKKPLGSGSAEKTELN